MGYIAIRIDRHDYLAHRLAWLYIYGRWPKGRLDHRDTNRANNIFENLREATQSQNLANARRRSDNTSGFKGVSLRKDTGRWAAYVNFEGKRYRLGCFDTKEAASAAYSRMAASLFGEFARPE